MSLWLRHFLYMKEYRSMGLPDGLYARLESLAHAGIVAGLHPVDIDPVGAFSFLESFQCFRYGPFRGLVFTGHRNAIAVIPDKDGGGYLQDARRIDGFPEMPFAGRGV